MSLPSQVWSDGISALCANAVERMVRLIGISCFEAVIVAGPPEFKAAHTNVRYKLPTGALSYNRAAANPGSATKLLIHKPWLGRC
jgi:hypothetical protein